MDVYGTISFYCKLFLQNNFFKNGLFCEQALLSKKVKLCSVLIVICLRVPVFVGIIYSNEERHSLVE